MYKDMYKQYNNEDFQYAYPFSFNSKPLDYLNSKCQPLYKWNYGDTVNIPFLIDKKFWEFPISITVYNFRYEPLYNIVDKVNEDGKIYLEIQAEESSTIFKQGVYYCGIQADETITDSEGEYVEGIVPRVITLMPPNACMIEVR